MDLTARRPVVSFPNDAALQRGIVRLMMQKSLFVKRILLFFFVLFLWKRWVLFSRRSIMMILLLRLHPCSLLFSRYCISSYMIGWWHDIYQSKWMDILTTVIKSKGRWSSLCGKLLVSRILNPFNLYFACGDWFTVSAHCVIVSLELWQLILLLITWTSCLP